MASPCGGRRTGCTASPLATVCTVQELTRRLLARAADEGLVFTTCPACDSTARRKISSWRASACRIASGCCSHRRVDTSKVSEQECDRPRRQLGHSLPLPGASTPPANPGHSPNPTNAFPDPVQASRPINSRSPRHRLRSEAPTEVDPGVVEVGWWSSASVVPAPTRPRSTRRGPRSRRGSGAASRPRLLKVANR
jgi:hypothetical protein